MSEEHPKIRISPELSREQRSWVKLAPVFPAEFSVVSLRGRSTYKILDRDESGIVHDLGSRMGAKGFVLRVEDAETEAVYAAKLCVPEDYDDQRTEFFETKLANKLRGADGLFVIPERAGRVTRFNEMPGPQDELVCFVSEWVSGCSLEQYCENTAGVVAPDFICSVSIEILRAIRFLRSRNLKHDDLHWGNIMIRERDPDLALLSDDRMEWRISLIDMGSLKQIDQQTSKSKDDYLSLVHLMTKLYNIAWKRRHIPSGYPAFVLGYRKIIEQMTEEDHLRFFPTEESLPRALRDLREELSRPQLPDLNRPFHPFEAISAEHLADDQTLVRLFEDSLPWFATVLEPKPIVLTGPRGCGKSMLLRYMAARTHFATVERKQDPLGAMSFFGVYVSCATHLQNNLMWIARKEGRVKELAASISTFFQLVMVRELLRALAVAYQSEAAKAAYGLTESGIDELVGFIGRFFSSPIETPRLTNRPRILHFADDIDRLRIALHLDLLNQRRPKVTLTDTFLGDVTTKLRSAIPRFSKIPVVFLLDDYSSNRIHPDIQAVLNRVIFERRDSHYFKITCEKFGFYPIDIDEIKIDPTREYEEIDAGSYALRDLTDATSKRFLSGLIDKRLEAADWKGRTSSLIGTSEKYSDDTVLARYIREEGSSQGRHFYYFGMDHLARLWSGDIATILQIVKEMFVLGSVNKDTESLIPAHLQHRAIVAVSKAFKERITGYYPFGPEMATILNNFGLMARQIMVSGQLDTGGNPRRYYRIEMTKDRPGSLLELLSEKSNNAGLLAKELLRRAVFVQLTESRGKEGPGSQTVRWEIRKIFLPAFGASLVRHNYINVTSLEDFLSFLTDSQRFCDRQNAKYELSKKQDKRTGSLFGDVAE